MFRYYSNKRLVLLFTRPTGATGEALVIYMNKIRMSVRPSVCLFKTYILPGSLARVYILYMVGSGIHPEVSLFVFRICPDNCPDAIVRKPDTIGKTQPKLTYF